MAEIFDELLARAVAETVASAQRLSLLRQTRHLVSLADAFDLRGLMGDQSYEITSLPTL